MQELASPLRKANPALFGRRNPCRRKQKATNKNKNGNLGGSVGGTLKLKHKERKDSLTLSQAIARTQSCASVPGSFHELDSGFTSLRTIPLSQTETRCYQH